MKKFTPFIFLFATAATLLAGTAKVAVDTKTHAVEIEDGSTIIDARGVTLTLGGFTISDATGVRTVFLGAANGVMFGAAGDKIGFLGATPIVRPSSTADLRQAFINLGLYTTGGATPLNLNGGAFTSGPLSSTTGSFSSTLGVTGNTTVGGTLGVTGPFSGSSLSLSGNATVGGAFSTTGNITTNGSISTIANQIYTQGLTLSDNGSLPSTDGGGIHLGLLSKKNEATLAGGMGTIKIFSNDPFVSGVEQFLQFSIGEQTDPNTDLRRGNIDVVEKGLFVGRQLTLNESGGTVIVGARTFPGATLAGFDSGTRAIQGQLYVHQGTDKNLEFSAKNTTVTGAVGIRAVNDAFSALAPMEVDATTLVYNVSGMAIGNLTPTAKLHLEGGTVSTAPFKFTAGTNTTVPQAGAMEWDGTNLSITQSSGPTRKTISYATLNVVTKTSAYTPSATDNEIRLNGTGGTFAITLPAATGSGKMYRFKRVDASGIATPINANGTDTIDGVSGINISTQYSTLTVIDAASGVWDKF